MTIFLTRECPGTPVCTSLLDLKNQLGFLGVEHLNAYINTFRASAFQRTNDQQRMGRKYQCSTDPHDIGPFAFFMRSLLMRHTQSQKYLGTETTLMSLPNKVRIFPYLRNVSVVATLLQTERNVVVPFNAADKPEYNLIEAQSKKVYLSSVSHMSVNKNYLFFQQIMTPLRTACAGGPVFATEKEDKGEDKEKKEPLVTHTYTSKLNALIVELTTVRESDPTGTATH